MAEATIVQLKTEIARVQGKFKNLRKMKDGPQRDVLLESYTKQVTKHSKRVLALGGKLDKFKG